MCKSNFAKVFLLLLISGFIAVQGQEQIKFQTNTSHLEISAGRTYHNYVSLGQNSSFEVFKNWKTGTSISIGYSKDILREVELIARAGYHYFPYSGNEERFYEGWLGYKVSAKNSHVYETSAGVRLGAVSELGPFLTAQTGLYFFDIGKIKITSRYMGSPEIVDVYVVRKTGKFDVKMCAAVGFGFNIPVSSRIKFKIEAKLSQTLSGDRDLNTVSAGLQFRL